MTENCGCRVNRYGYKCIDCGEYDSATIVYCPLHANAGRLLEAAKELSNLYFKAISEAYPDWDFPTDRPYQKTKQAIASAEGKT